VVGNTVVFIRKFGCRRAGTENFRIDSCPESAYATVTVFWPTDLYWSCS